MRFVGYNDRDGGFIDSVGDSITYPLSGISKRSDLYVEDNFNDSVKEGYRAALRVDLNENWKLDVNQMGQVTETDGVWDHNPDELGEYNVSRFFDDSTYDDWDRLSITLSGDLGFADLTFTTSSLDRNFEVLSDYSHYSIDGYVEGYYTCYEYYFGPCVDPSIQFISDTTQSYDTTEIRLASNSDSKLNWIIGAFYTENETDFNSQWAVPAIDWPSTVTQSNMDGTTDGRGRLGGGRGAYEEAMSAVEEGCNEAVIVLCDVNIIIMQTLTKWTSVCIKLYYTNLEYLSLIHI